MRLSLAQIQSFEAEVRQVVVMLPLLDVCFVEGIANWGFRSRTRKNEARDVQTRKSESQLSISVKKFPKAVRVSAFTALMRQGPGLHPAFLVRLAGLNKKSDIAIGGKYSK